MSNDDVLLERDGATAILTLNRPDRGNSLTDGMLHQLQEALFALEDDTAVGAVVLRGAGPSFCGGFDLGSGPPRTGRRAFQAHADLAGRTFWHIWNSRLPFIAAVRGYCLGGAVYLTGVCDFVLTTADAQIGMSELKFGMAPPLFNLFPWLLSNRHAREFLMTGDAIRGTRAVEIDLMTRVVPDADLDAACMALAAKLARMPDGAVHTMKRSINVRWELAGIVAGVEDGIRGFVENKVQMGPVQAEFRRLSREIGSGAALRQLGIDLGLEPLPGSTSDWPQTR